MLGYPIPTSMDSTQLYSYRNCFKMLQIWNPSSRLLNFRSRSPGKIDGDTLGASISEPPTAHLPVHPPLPLLLLQSESIGGTNISINSSRDRDSSNSKGRNNSIFLGPLIKLNQIKFRGTGWIESRSKPNRSLNHDNEVAPEGRRFRRKSSSSSSNNTSNSSNSSNNSSNSSTTLEASKINNSSTDNSNSKWPVVSRSFGNTHLMMNLSGSSSSPVEPIKPLLELGTGEAGAPLIVPPHPVFDDAAPKNVSALAGNAAYLHCLVHNLANKSVSWIRQRDLHILTVGRYTYTTDQRYQVIHSQGSKDWILKINYAQVRDTGNYECQVSTKPVRAYGVKLNVFAPHAEIIGAPDMHVDKGSTINLTCIIAHSPEPPAYIFWHHNGNVINYKSPRGGITVVTERGNATTGYLLIQDARPSDTGNYSCSPSNTASTFLRVHVLNGETPAAMQTNGAWTAVMFPRVRSFLWSLFTILCSTILLRYLLGQATIPGGGVERADGGGGRRVGIRVEDGVGRGVSHSTYLHPVAGVPRGPSGIRRNICWKRYRVN